MNVFKLIRVSVLSLVALTGLAACGRGSGGREASDKQPSPDQDEEARMGQEVFNELKAEGEIIESSPLYDHLNPLPCAITTPAKPRSNHAVTLRGPACAPLRATTRGDSYGCSRILRTRRLGRYHSFYRITPMTKIEFIR